MTVFDWGQTPTRDFFMDVVDLALDSGITSFFFDKASVQSNDNKICNHVCSELNPDVATRWNSGHLALLRQAANKSTGPTVGNGGATLCSDVMGGCHAPFAPTGKAIEDLIELTANNHVSSIFAGFPFSTDGYAAFLQVRIHLLLSIVSFIGACIQTFMHVRSCLRLMIMVIRLRATNQADPGCGSTLMLRCGSRNSTILWARQWHQRWYVIKPLQLIVPVVFSHFS